MKLLFVWCVQDEIDLLFKIYRKIMQLIGMREIDFNEKKLNVVGEENDNDNDE